MSKVLDQDRGTQGFHIHSMHHGTVNNESTATRENHQEQDVPLKRMKGHGGRRSGKLPRDQQKHERNAGITEK